MIESKTNNRRRNKTNNRIRNKTNRRRNKTNRRRNKTNNRRRTKTNNRRRNKTNNRRRNRTNNRRRNRTNNYKSNKNIRKLKRKIKNKKRNKYKQIQTGGSKIDDNFYINFAGSTFFYSRLPKKIGEITEALLLEVEQQKNHRLKLDRYQTVKVAREEVLALQEKEVSQHQAEEEMRRAHERQEEEMRRAHEEQEEEMRQSHEEMRRAHERQEEGMRQSHEEMEKANEEAEEEMRLDHEKKEVEMRQFHEEMEKANEEAAEKMRLDHEKKEVEMLRAHEEQEEKMRKAHEEGIKVVQRKLKIAKDRMAREEARLVLGLPDPFQFLRDILLNKRTDRFLKPIYGFVKKRNSMNDYYLALMIESYYDPGNHGISIGRMVCWACDDLVFTKNKKNEKKLQPSLKILYEGLNHALMPHDRGGGLNLLGPLDRDKFKYALGPERKEYNFTVIGGMPRSQAEQVMRRKLFMYDFFVLDDSTNYDSFVPAEASVLNHHTQSFITFPCNYIPKPLSSHENGHDEKKIKKVLNAFALKVPGILGGRHLWNRAREKVHEIVTQRKEVQTVAAFQSMGTVVDLFTYKVEIPEDYSDKDKYVTLYPLKDVILALKLIYVNKVDPNKILTHEFFVEVPDTHIPGLSLVVNVSSIKIGSFVNTGNYRVTEVEIPIEQLESNSLIHVTAADVEGEIGVFFTPDMQSFAKSKGQENFIVVFDSSSGDSSPAASPLSEPFDITKKLPKNTEQLKSENDAELDRSSFTEFRYFVETKLGAVLKDLHRTSEAMESVGLPGEWKEKTAIEIFETVVREFFEGVWLLIDNLDEEIQELRGLVDLSWHDWRVANHLIDTFSERLKREMGFYSAVGNTPSHIGYGNEAADKSLVEEKTELLRVMINNLEERFYASTQRIVLKGVSVPFEGETPPSVEGTEGTEDSEKL